MLPYWSFSLLNNNNRVSYTNTMFDIFKYVEVSNFRIHLDSMSASSLHIFAEG